MWVPVLICIGVLSLKRGLGIFLSFSECRIYKMQKYLCPAFQSQLVFRVVLLLSGLILNTVIPVTSLLIVTISGILDFMEVVRLE